MKGITNVYIVVVLIAATYIAIKAKKYGHMGHAISYFLACLAIPVIGVLAALVELGILKKQYYIRKATEDLADGLSDSKVIEYINLIKNTNIPNKPETWNALRASNNLVKKNKNVSEDVKDRLTMTLQSKGVSGVY